ncbi:deoxyribodipyrimidine photolyase [Salibacteraceae bacterium]|jgi:deoxyribodipyrimidine photo-lyase|nr:deoxyribodipyrimidine photolyase [Salibacteraceae bacterium]MDB9708654.1 deoxyribodipyrimidine photolyase [Salibacteraceae bacterium]MDC1220162.1 deoxyribodipyrimidine photolyase [bacterium]MDC1304874.1 deoxyribodipyrimidine photolyase [Salibacteraceae bacterium]HAQ72255.1 deoxyribodipyrimidine photolyase [Flavobacteriales bacterium]
MSFPTNISEIEKRIQSIDPIGYAATRNFKDGAITQLGPYISRGVISTNQVFEHIKSLNLPWSSAEKLIQELAWRDYWQQVWIAKGNEIHSDIKHKQAPISNYEMPKAIIEAKTGIDEVDKAIQKLYETGYMHNHMRMYVASICCNIANSHWLEPAKWMYHHLLDGDLASNYLSWQWVAGAFSNKKYYANQDNINTYFKSTQKRTFLDVEYESFSTMVIPDQLTQTIQAGLSTVLPEQKKCSIEKDKITLVYNYYNIDPYWHHNEDVQRIFLLEPSHFGSHPISKRCLDFALNLTSNIKGMQLFVGEFAELSALLNPSMIVYKEHPTSSHYQGTEEAREWMSSVKGYYPSFFAFWKKAKKEINQDTSFV